MLLEKTHSGIHPTTRYLTPPGTEYSYSNIGFGILGFAMERAAGEPFMDQVEARIFEPLGWRASTFIVGDGLLPQLSEGHANNADGNVNTERPAQEHRGAVQGPDGGVYSTVDDLAAFAAGVMGRGGASLPSDEMRAELLSVQTPEDPESGYGLGFSILTADGRLFAGHGGSGVGIHRSLTFEPATGLTVVLAAQLQPGPHEPGPRGAGAAGGAAGKKLELQTQSAPTRMISPRFLAESSPTSDMLTMPKP